jgi:hypothetical protein
MLISILRAKDILSPARCHLWKIKPRRALTRAGADVQAGTKTSFNATKQG